MIKICLQCGINKTDKPICDECDRSNLADYEAIKKHIENGHSEHCANRLVWGDGECECDLYEKGYDPYAWQNL